MSVAAAILSDQSLTQAEKIDFLSQRNSIRYSFLSEENRKSVFNELQLTYIWGLDGNQPKLDYVTKFHISKV